MEHLALLLLILGVVVLGVVVLLKRTSKADPVEQNPMRGTTRRDHL